MTLTHETGLLTAPVPVYFETFAPAAATGRPTVVMVHGGAHSGACYQRTADGRRGWAYLFAARGYPTVVPDWPGTGRSGYIPLDQLNGATVVEGLGALIRSLGAPVVLLTHSMSGCYGWRLLELHGDLIDAVVGVAPGPPGNIQSAGAGLCGDRNRDRDREHPGGAFASSRPRRWSPRVNSSERKLVGESRYFPRDRLAGYAASLGPIPPEHPARAAERARPPGARERSEARRQARARHHGHRRSRPRARGRRRHRRLAQRQWCQGRLLLSRRPRYCRQRPYADAGRTTATTSPESSSTRSMPRATGPHP